MAVRYGRGVEHVSNMVLQCLDLVKQPELLVFGPAVAIAYVTDHATTVVDIDINVHHNHKYVLRI